MNQTLQMGANTVLNSPKGQLSISYEVSSAIDISLTAFLLTDSNLVQGDNGIIFTISRRVLRVSRHFYQQRYQIS